MSNILLLLYSNILKYDTSFKPLIVGKMTKHVTKNGKNWISGTWCKFSSICSDVLRGGG